MQRLDDARHLMKGDRTTGAVYLAGYAVECMLKALLLSQVAPSRRVGILADFRGKRGHDFRRLKADYLKYGGPPVPTTMIRPFAMVVSWTTDLRYFAGTIARADAKTFMANAENLIQWMDGWEALACHEKTRLRSTKT